MLDAGNELPSLLKLRRSRHFAPQQGAGREDSGSAPDETNQAAAARSGAWNCSVSVLPARAVVELVPPWIAWVTLSK